jgi:hypothetical protein
MDGPSAKPAGSRPGALPDWSSRASPSPPDQPGQPPYGQPPYGQPPYGQPAGMWAAPPPARRSRLPLIITGIVVLVIIAVAGLFAVSYLKNHQDAGKVVFSTDKPVAGQTVGCSVDHQLTPWRPARRSTRRTSSRRARAPPSSRSPSPRTGRRTCPPPKCPLRTPRARLLRRHHRSQHDLPGGNIQVHTDIRRHHDRRGNAHRHARSFGAASRPISRSQEHRLATDRGGVPFYRGGPPGRLLWAARMWQAIRSRSVFGDLVETDRDPRPVSTSGSPATRRRTEREPGSRRCGRPAHRRRRFRLAVSARATRN